MSYVETPLLSDDGITDGEKLEIQAGSCPKCYIICFMIIWWLITGFAFVFAIITSPLMCLYASVFIVIGFIPGFCTDNETEVAINNKNHTLTFETKKVFNCCCKNKPQIFDLNRIRKIIFILNPTTEKMSKNNYKIIYKDGKIEDVSKYFAQLGEEILVTCQEFFRKYINVEDKLFPFLNIRYTTSNEGNSYTIPIQTVVYNGDTPKETPQNDNEQGYTPSGDIYTNPNDFNQNDSVKQNIPNEEDIKPASTKPEDYGAPNPSQ